MSDTESFDAIVIGAGQAGPSLAARLAQAGRRTALVEKRRLGGTCVNDGCIPTKTLVASARAAWVVRNASRWGVSAGGEMRVDMKAVKARKDAVVGESRAGLGAWLGALPGLSLVDGEARFIDANTVRVVDHQGGERRLQGRQFFLNVGARPVLPAVPGLAEAPHFTNENIMEVDFVPPHLVILGGSYIGLEFAQMYRRFGSEVTVIERSERLLPREDVEVSRVLADMMSGEGVRLVMGCDARRVQHGANDSRPWVKMQVANASAGDAEAVIEGSHLLVAVGRAPAVASLGLAAAGVALDARGYVATDDRLVTSQPHIWALGDCNGRGAFTHTSYDDYLIAAANLLDGGDRKVSQRIPIYALYTDPPLGRCGMTRAQAVATGRPLLVGHRPMTRVGRAHERGETTGFMEVVVDAESRRILGAAILGIEGDEAIHCFADVMYAGVPCDVLARAVHAHPTVAELIPTVIQELRPM